MNHAGPERNKMIKEYKVNNDGIVHEMEKIQHETQAKQQKIGGMQQTTESGMHIGITQRIAQMIAIKNGQHQQQHQRRKTKIQKRARRTSGTMKTMAKRIAKIMIE